ncbi:MAG: HlyD family efflux transporter periplasmic adaptor subunit [Hydrogenophaga sp.]|nr:HlyD family efflux transporter periplasmic adaptor subunit [Hydrogenophaga sp.]
MLAVVAAVVMHVDKIVPAKGVLETPLGVFTVRNMQSGHVKEIAVKAGDSVQPGQVLVRFDARMTELEIDKLQADKEVTTRKAWSDALMVKSQLSAADQLLLEQRLAHLPRPKTLAGFDSRLSQHTQRVQAVYSANQRTTAAKLRDLSQQLALQQQSLLLQQQELAKAEHLVKEGFESDASLLTKRRAFVDMQAREHALLAEMGGLKGELARLGHDESRQLGDLALEQLRRIDTAIGDHDRAEAELALRQKMRERMTVKAPFAGTVDHIHLKGAGEFVSDNSSLVSLRQGLASDEMEIDIVLPGSQAIWVKSGMRFRAIAADNNPEDHGYLKGEITFVSQSTHEVKDVLSYRLKGRITDWALKPGIGRETLLRPGMDLRVEIITGSRSVMSYLLDPIEKTLREAMTEPN